MDAGGTVDHPNFSEDSARVLDGNLYALEELNQVNKGLAPRGFVDEVTALEKASSKGTTSWDISSLMFSEGL